MCQTVRRCWLRILGIILASLAFIVFLWGNKTVLATDSYTTDTTVNYAKTKHERTVFEESYGWGPFTYITIHYQPVREVEVNFTGLWLSVLATIISTAAATILIYRACLTAGAHQTSSPPVSCP